MSDPTDITLPHTPAEDLLGVLTGTFLAALGLHILHASQAVTGGTAGLSLLLTYAAPLSLPVMLLLVNLPFFALALWKKGLQFTIRTAVSIGLLSAFTALAGRMLPVHDVEPLFGVIAGNLLAGVGILILFRHGASLGGFSVVALIAQERAGLRAGYVQMGLDVLVVVAAVLVVPLTSVLISAVGVALLNLVLAFNHRPGRYRA